MPKLDTIDLSPEVDPNHHLLTNLSLPIGERVSLERHRSERRWLELYELAQEVLDEVHTKLGIEAPEPEVTPYVPPVVKEENNPFLTEESDEEETPVAIAPVVSEAKESEETDEEGDSTPWTEEEKADAAAFEAEAVGA